MRGAWRKEKRHVVPPAMLVLLPFSAVDLWCSTAEVVITAPWPSLFRPFLHRGNALRPKTSSELVQRCPESCSQHQIKQSRCGQLGLAVLS
jgi:hypothetical protein